MKKDHIKFIKITLAAIFVMAVAFFVVKGCVRRHPHPTPQPVQQIPVRVAKPSPPAPPLPVPVLKEAKMAIILDDWGLNPRILPLAYDIGRPLTISILPSLRYSKKIAEEGSAHQLGIMLHMPMQPKGKKAPLEPHTILTTTPDADIKKYLASALASVPHAEGVNNHMGSAATSDLRVMRTVMSYLNTRNLFFVDSEVISTSVGARMAKETGILFGRRQVFIDNEAKEISIKKQLERAKKIALSTGRVIVIGHDKELTLKTIKEVVPEFEKAGIKFVYARDLVEKA